VIFRTAPLLPDLGRSLEPCSCKAEAEKQKHEFLPDKQI